MGIGMYGRSMGQWNRAGHWLVWQVGRWKGSGVVTR